MATVISVLRRNKQVPIGGPAHKVNTTYGNGGIAGGNQKARQTKGILARTAIPKILQTGSGEPNPRPKTIKRPPARWGPVPLRR
ncbi:MAG: hypothetical protein UX94_C0001G0032 [Parcubacteria group bacterium GW2011_GWA2_47_21]|nr:MAG: hypothetical protein UX94_C0001G0032 [Parcubacteria group bacterium GW2011_GWA2_47_21]